MLIDESGLIEGTDFQIAFIEEGSAERTFQVSSLVDEFDGFDNVVIHIYLAVDTEFPVYPADVTARVDKNLKDFAAGESHFRGSVSGNGIIIFSGEGDFFDLFKVKLIGCRSQFRSSPDPEEVFQFPIRIEIAHIGKEKLGFLIIYDFCRKEGSVIEGLREKTCCEKR